jgi:D-glycero-alpha-D-manno-heptose 1-phosphate guanylyltransferase
MAPVAGRPFLEILLDRLIDSGCERVLLSVGYLRHLIQQAFDADYRGIPIHYVIEETPLGTGGAIRLALEHTTEASVLVINGDTYADADFLALLTVHREGKHPMTMAVTHVEDVGRYGGVVVENGVVSGFTEKGLTGPGWINAGAYVLDREFPWPAELPSRFSFETDFLAPCIAEFHPNAYMFNGYFLDIGIPEDLDRAQIELAKLAVQASHRGSAQSGLPTDE